ncbi:MAG: peptide deformylase, partial [Patescibacteria group bacterium]
GCLSIPRIWAPVPRSKRVLLEYQNEQGELQQKWFSKLKSIVVQHEVDHLQGVLFTQRVVEQNLPLYEEHGDKLERIRSI